MSAPIEQYRRRTESGELEPDTAQQQAIEALDRLYHELVGAGTPSRGWQHRISRLLSKTAAPVKGIYLWGGVGKGQDFSHGLVLQLLALR